jgi:hypothetical protein
LSAGGTFAFGCTTVAVGSVASNTHDGLLPLFRPFDIGTFALFDLSGPFLMHPNPTLTKIFCHSSGDRIIISDTPAGDVPGVANSWFVEGENERDERLRIFRFLSHHSFINLANHHVLTYVTEISPRKTLHCSAQP